MNNKYSYYKFKTCIDSNDISMVDIMMLKDKKIFLNFIIDKGAKHKVGIITSLGFNTVEIYTSEKVANWICDKNLKIKYNKDHYNKLYFYCDTRLFPGIYINKLEYNLYSEISKNCSISTVDDFLYKNSIKSGE